MPLTNTVKELEENLDFGIQKLIKPEPGMIPVNNDDEKHLGSDGDADEPRSDDVGRGLGATTKRTKLFFHKN